MEYEVYHGRTVADATFDLKYVGSKAANDQYGPGFYFTDVESEAARFSESGGSVIRAMITINHPMSMKAKVTKKQVTYMIRSAPSVKSIVSAARKGRDAQEEAFYESPLSNFGETFLKAFNEAVDGYLGMELFHAMTTLQRDFYRDDPADYLRNVRKLGYDGIIIPSEATIFVVFDPSQIKVLDVKLVESREEPMRNFIKSFERDNNKPLIEAILSGYKSIFEADDRQNDPSVDTIKGGMSDGMTVKDIAEKHGVSVDSIIAQVEKGIKVEREHTTDDEKATEIAMDHLAEIPDYYDRLATMEHKAKKSMGERGDKSASDDESESEDD
jgi:hypothetical protein